MNNWHLEINICSVLVHLRISYNKKVWLFFFWKLHGIKIFFSEPELTWDITKPEIIVTCCTDVFFVYKWLKYIFRGGFEKKPWRKAKECERFFGTWQMTGRCWDSLADLPLGSSGGPRLVNITSQPSFFVAIIFTLHIHFIEDTFKSTMEKSHSLSYYWTGSLVFSDHISIKMMVYANPDHG